MINRETGSRETEGHRRTERGTDVPSKGKSRRELETEIERDRHTERRRERGRCWDRC